MNASPIRRVAMPASSSLLSLVVLPLVVACSSTGATAAGGANDAGGSQSASSTGSAEGTQLSAFSAVATEATVATHSPQFDGGVPTGTGNVHMIDILVSNLANTCGPFRGGRRSSVNLRLKDRGR